MPACAQDAERNRERVLAAARELFADRMAAYVAATDEALADPDPWRGFCGYIERVCRMQADDRVLSHLRRGRCTVR